ncbi:angiopoietin-related protein 5-like [Hoplias malabaricus]|uniref:angiopoietin-related protein 5-like n=1 Tax=Hoplias malabaricus TaxID=27720 RepID=UPI00346232C5
MRIKMVNMMMSRVRLLVLLMCVVTAQGLQAQSSMIKMPKDCTDIKNVIPSAQSGIFTIWPSASKMSFKVYCEMRKDGGWTVLQRRTGGDVSFNKKWAEYKSGFGTLNNDHWLGLYKISALTNEKNRSMTLRVDLFDFEGGSAFAEYQHFKVGDEASAYKLSVGEYSGNAGDAIRGAYSGIDQNGYGFSTSDRDNDGCSPCIFGDIALNDCSAHEGGGWWFSRCGSADLNGEWHPKNNNKGWASGLHWLTWKAPEPYSAKATRMMVKSM